MSTPSNVHTASRASASPSFSPLNQRSRLPALPNVRPVTLAKADRTASKSGCSRVFIRSMQRDTTLR